MNALNIAVFVCVIFTKPTVVESLTSLELRSDVECPEDWTYAFDSKCVHFYPDSTMQQATMTCQKSMSDLGTSLDALQTVVVLSLAQYQDLRLEQVWFGQHTENQDEFGEIPACSKDVDMKRKCVKLEQVWFGQHTENQDEFGEIPACSKDVDMKRKCVKLVFTGSGSRCWSTEACDVLLPFFCIGDAALLRMNSMSTGGGGH